MVPWASGWRLKKPSQTLTSTAAGVIKQPTCSTAFPSQIRQKPRPYCTTFGVLRPREKPRKRSLFSSKPLRTNTQKRRPLCNKTKPNCAPSTTFQRLTGRASDRQIQSCPLYHDPPPDKAIKDLPETKEHASHHVQTWTMRSGKLVVHKRRHSPRRHQQWHRIPRRRIPKPTKNSRRMIKCLTPELTIAQQLKRRRPTLQFGEYVNDDTG